MKNMKIAAAAMVMVMLVSATMVGINATSYDAEDGAATPYTYNVNLSNNNKVVVELMSNINYYSNLGGATIEWEVKAGNPATNVDKLNEKYSKDNVSVQPNVNGDITKTILTVTVEKGENASSVDFLLTATVRVTEGMTTTEDGTKTGGTTVTLDPITYKISVTIEDASDVTFKGMTFVKNVNATRTLTIGSNDIDITGENKNSPYYGAKIYATGLPAGLSMTPDGKVSGIPTEATADNGVSAKVFIEKTNGTVIIGTLNVTVLNFSYTVISDNTTIGSSNPSVNEANNPSTFIVEQNANLKITNISTGATHISVVKVDNTYTPDSDRVAISNNECNLTGFTAGTGVYKVYIGCAEDNSPTSLSKVLASFDLYVVGHVVGVGSGIIIGSR